MTKQEKYSSTSTSESPDIFKQAEGFLSRDWDNGIE